MIQGMEASKTIPVPRTPPQQDYAGKHIHLIGVGGSGMRALAQMLLARGAVISGSDQAPSATVHRLREAGATIAIGQKPENIPANAETVVFSAAIHDANPELLAAQQRGLKLYKYSHMLGELMSRRVGVAVSGTHGKSTTTAMVAYVLSAAGSEPSFIVGATVEQLGGPSGVGDGKHFVAEACEFDRSFLSLHPTFAAILNIEEDHLDCYADIEAIIQAFRAFSARVPANGVIVANGEDRNVAAAVKDAHAEVETFGQADGCTWRAINIQQDNGRYTAEFLYKGKPFVTMAIPLPGLHNVYNSLAATALLHHAGLESHVIAQHLSQFKGTRRRMTLKGQARGITVLDDYAHHPTEIQVTLRAIRDFYRPKRLICVFQPHQHSRTRFLLKDFARSFGCATEVVVPDIYFVRDSAQEKDYISSEDLVAQIRLNGGCAIYLKTFEDIVSHLKANLVEGDLVVTMGAGNVWEVADETVRWLGRDS